MSIVRTSHYRHVKGDVKDKRELLWANVKPATTVTETNKVSVNKTGKLAAVCWQVGGGGAVGIIKLDAPYRVEPNDPLVTGHRGPVSDVKFDPFHESILATASDDGAVRIWDIPTGGLTETLTDPMLTLEGHIKKVVALAWNPVAASVLVSVGQDQEAIVWNIENGTEISKVNIGQYPTDVSFSPCGTLFAVSCKDKKIYIYDARTGEKRFELLPHSGPRTPRMVWMKDLKIITLGNAAGAYREFKMWDVAESTTEPILTERVSDGTQTLYPFYDVGTSILYLVGKGDSSLRYYEIVHEQVRGTADFAWKAHHINNTMVPAAVGLAAAPKYLMDVNQVEIMRFFLLSKDSLCQVNYNVPRRVKAYDPAIYPDTWAGVAACTAVEWVGGSTAAPVMKSMKPDGAAPAAAPEKKFTPTVTGKVETRPKTTEEQLTELKDKYAKLLAAYERDAGKKYEE